MWPSGSGEIHTFAQAGGITIAPIGASAPACVTSAPDGPRYRKPSPARSRVIPGPAGSLRVNPGTAAASGDAPGLMPRQRTPPGPQAPRQPLLERQPRRVEAPGAGERLDVPKRARREGAFGAAHPVRAGLRVVPVDQGIGYQGGGQGVEGGQPLGSVGEMNLTSGISNTAASRTAPPSHRANAFSPGDQPRSMIRREIASRAVRPPSR